MTPKEQGEMLLATKCTVGHGKFKSWIAANCTYTYRTAARLMALAKGENAEPKVPSKVPPAVAKSDTAAPEAQGSDATLPELAVPAVAPRPEPSAGRIRGINLNDPAEREALLSRGWHRVR
jgi:hypothetical protein